jgi:transcriptional regulator with XRE-family HTH domain
MAHNSENIYQIARESAGMTQEKAAELIYISVESIKAYETDRRLPPNDVVAKMVEVYGSRYLAYQHLKNSNPIARDILPNIEIKDIPAAILKLQKEVTDFIKCRDELIDITYDGIITDEERPRFDVIMKELNDIVDAIASLEYAAEKKNQ